MIVPNSRPINVDDDNYAEDSSFSSIKRPVIARKVSKIKGEAHKSVHYYPLCRSKHAVDRSHIAHSLAINTSSPLAAKPRTYSTRPPMPFLGDLLQYAPESAVKLRSQSSLSAEYAIEKHSPFTRRCNTPEARRARMRLFPPSPPRSQTASPKKDVVPSLKLEETSLPRSVNTTLGDVTFNFKWRPKPPIGLVDDERVEMDEESLIAQQHILDMDVPNFFNDFVEEPLGVSKRVLGLDTKDPVVFQHRLRANRERPRSGYSLTTPPITPYFPTPKESSSGDEKGANQPASLENYAAVTVVDEFPGAGRRSDSEDSDNSSYTPLKSVSDRTVSPSNHIHALASSLTPGASKFTALQSLDAQARYHYEQDHAVAHHDRISSAHPTADPAGSGRRGAPPSYMPPIISREASAAVDSEDVASKGGEVEEVGGARSRAGSLTKLSLAALAASASHARGGGGGGGGGGSSVGGGAGAGGGAVRAPVYDDEDDATSLCSSQQQPSQRVIASNSDAIAFNSDAIASSSDAIASDIQDSARSGSVSAVAAATVANGGRRGSVVGGKRRNSVVAGGGGGGGGGRRGSVNAMARRASIVAGEITRRDSVVAGEGAGQGTASRRGSVFGGGARRRGSVASVVSSCDTQRDEMTPGGDTTARSRGGGEDTPLVGRGSKSGSVSTARRGSVLGRRTSVDVGVFRRLSVVAAPDPLMEAIAAAAAAATAAEENMDAAARLTSMVEASVGPESRGTGRHTHVRRRSVVGNSTRRRRSVVGQDLRDPDRGQPDEESRQLKSSPRLWELPNSNKVPNVSSDNLVPDPESGAETALVRSNHRVFSAPEDLTNVLYVPPEAELTLEEEIVARAKAVSLAAMEKRKLRKVSSRGTDSATDSLQENNLPPSEPESEVQSFEADSSLLGLPSADVALAVVNESDEAAEADRDRHVKRMAISRAKQGVFARRLGRVGVAEAEEDDGDADNPPLLELLPSQMKWLKSELWDQLVDASISKIRPVAAREKHEFLAHDPESMFNVYPHVDPSIHLTGNDGLPLKGAVVIRLQQTTRFSLEELRDIFHYFNSVVGGPKSTRGMSVSEFVYGLPWTTTHFTIARVTRFFEVINVHPVNGKMCRLDFAVGLGRLMRSTPYERYLLLYDFIGGISGEAVCLSDLLTICVEENGSMFETIQLVECVLACFSAPAFTAESGRTSRSSSRHSRRASDAAASDSDAADPSKSAKSNDASKLNDDSKRKFTQTQFLSAARTQACVVACLECMLPVIQSDFLKTPTALDKDPDRGSLIYSHTVGKQLFLREWSWSRLMDLASFVQNKMNSVKVVKLSFVTNICSLYFSNFGTQFAETVEALLATVTGKSSTVTFYQLTEAISISAISRFKTAGPGATGPAGAVSSRPSIFASSEDSAEVGKVPPGEAREQLHGQKNATASVGPRSLLRSDSTFRLPKSDKL